MATTVRFDPQAVFAPSTSGEAAYETRVQGSSPQWADADDSTYGVSWTLIRTDEAEITSTTHLTVLASFPTVDVGSTIITDVTAHLRASATNDQGGTGSGFYVGVTPNTAGHPSSGYYATGTLPADGVLRDLTVSFDAADLAALQDLLAQSYAAIVVGRLPGAGDPSPSAYSITVTELWLDVTYDAAPPPPPPAATAAGPLRAPALRQFQRSRL